MTTAISIQNKRVVRLSVILSNNEFGGGYFVVTCKRIRNIEHKPLNIENTKTYVQNFVENLIFVNFN